MLVYLCIYFYSYSTREKRGQKNKIGGGRRRKKNGVNNGDGNELLRERGALTSGRHNIVVIVLVVFVDIMYGMSDKKS